MDKISINLLPFEVTALEKTSAKKLQIFKLSFGLLVVMILITVSILILRLFQSRTISVVNTQLVTSEQKVNNLKDQESQLVLLKDRLSSISTLSQKDFKTTDGFNLISSITPSNISLSAVSLDKSGTIVLSAEAPDLITLKTFFDNLTIPAINQGKIGKISIDNLNNFSSGKYRVNLTINLL